MMRITNSMMTSNTKNNINLNKLNEDKINTMMATGQKITRPSDDPVIAIRALRLNTNISQLNQYHEKNIPDAEHWLNITETALSQTDVIFDRISENLTTGASDTNTASDRQKLLTSLKGLRDEFYSTGNADYAGRTVFTGYRTGEPLTFLATDTDLNANYMIHQPLTADDVDKITYVTSGEYDDGGVKKYDENLVESLEVSRIRLPYDTIKAEDGSTINIDVYDKDGNNIGTAVTALVVSTKGKSQEEMDKLYKELSDNTKGGHDPMAFLIPETGEMILCSHAVDSLKSVTPPDSLAIEYNKDSWQPADLRPEHYFACVKTENGKDVCYNYELDPMTGKPNPAKPDFKEQDIEVEISFNQKITINTHASTVYKHDIGRDIDDLLIATQDVVDLDDKKKSLSDSIASQNLIIDKADARIAEAQKIIDSATASAAEKATATATKAAAEAEKSDAQNLIPELQNELDTVGKEYDFKKNKMQKMFSKALDIFKGYADTNNVAIADIGSLSSRLKITKERVADQLQSFTELADDNINISVTDTAIDLKNASLALQAAQMSAGKIAQQSLLNYI